MKLLPWVQVSSGTYRVNRTKVITKSTGSVNISFQNGRAIVTADDLRSIPLFAGLEGDVLSRISSSFKVEEAEIGKAVVTQGDERDKLYIVANGKVEVLRKGQQGEELQLRLLSSGNYFGDKDLLNNNPSSVTVRALSSSVLLTLSLKELNGLFKEIPSLLNYKQLSKILHVQKHRQINLVKRKLNLFRITMKLRTYQKLLLIMRLNQLSIR